MGLEPTQVSLYAPQAYASAKFRQSRMSTSVTLPVCKVVDVGVHTIVGNDIFSWSEQRKKALSE